VLHNDYKCVKANKWCIRCRNICREVRHIGEWFPVSVTHCLHAQCNSRSTDLHIYKHWMSFVNISNKHDTNAVERPVQTLQICVTKHNNHFRQQNMCHNTLPSFLATKVTKLNLKMGFKVKGQGQMQPHLIGQ